MNKVATFQTKEEWKIVTNSPLHMAVKEGNNKTVDTILEYMAKIDVNASHMFRDIFDKLIVFQNMKAYIENLPNTTNQMLKKQVLKVSNSHSDEIISMTESNSIYVDNIFYHEKMKERLNDSSCSSFPVRVQAMRIDWMLDSVDGIDGVLFLGEILKNEDLSFYNIRSLRMIIEFLYKKIKLVIIALMLPSFLCNLVLFIAVAMINEKLRTVYIKPKDPKDTDMVIGNEESAFWTNVMIIVLSLNFFFVILQSIIGFFIFKMMGMGYWQRFWSWVDLGIFVVSITIII